jgi:hypothetical protein
MHSTSQETPQISPNDLRRITRVTVHCRAIRYAY